MKKISTLTAVAILAVGISPHLAGAYQIAGYATQLTQGTTGDTGGYIFIGNGKTGTPGYVTIKLKNTDVSTRTLNSIALVGCTQSTIAASGCYVAANKTSAGESFAAGEIRTVTLPFDTTPATTTMKADQYYYLTWAASANTFVLYGYTNSTSAWEEGQYCRNIDDPIDGTCAFFDATIRTAFFSLESAGAETSTTTTSILNVQPPRRSATSSPTTLNAEIRVSEDDIEQHGYVTARFTIASMSQAGVLPAVTVQQEVYRTNIYTSGTQRYQEIVTGLEAEYQMWVYVEGGGSYITSTTTTFTVGTSTVWGQIQLNGLDQQAQIAEALTATTTSGYAAQCAVWYGNSGAFHDCMTYLFVPSTEYIAEAAKETLSYILFSFPIGYMSRTVQIFQEASTVGDTSVLPELVLEFPSNSVAAGHSIDLTPWDDLLGEDSMLSTATDYDSGLTIREIVEPLWVNVVYALFVFGVAMEILKFNDWGYGEGTSQTTTFGADRKGRYFNRTVFTKSTSRFRRR